MSAEEDHKLFYGRMIHAIETDDFETLKTGFLKFDKYRKKLLKMTLTIDGNSGSTLLHYALRRGVSDKMIEFLVSYPHDAPAKSNGQTYYDIAVEKKNLFAANLVIPSEEKERLLNDIVPEAAHAIENSQSDTLDGLLEQHMILFALPFPNKYNIFMYAIKHKATSDIIHVIIKYATIYKVPINKEELYKQATNEYAPNAVLKLLEPSPTINSSLFAGLTTRSPTATALAPLNRYISHYNIKTIDGLKVMTLLKGTLLFNAYEVITSDARKGKQFGEIFYSDNTYLQLLNGILPLSTSITHDDKTVKIKGCIDKNSSKFFYANPAGGPALGNVHTTFNTLAAFELKHDINVVVLMSPSHQHRLAGTRHDAVKTCDTFATGYLSKTEPYAYCKCSHHKEIGCPYAFPYDVCINPSFLKKHNIHGHMAIAEADTYNKLMYNFDFEFAINGIIPDKYKKLNYQIFKSCVSVDKRPHENINDYTNDLIGFPEIVLQLYGSQWYENTVHEQRFEEEIPIEDNDVPKTIVKYLLTADTSRLFKNADNPLQLKYVATSRAFYNLTNGNVIQNPFMKEAIYDEINKEFATYYYLNYLEAYLRGEINFFVDPRNGFLMNASSSTELIINNNSKKYKRIKLEEYIDKSASSGTLFEKSAKLRVGNLPYFWSTLLYPNSFRPARIEDKDSNSVSPKSGGPKSGSPKSGGGITRKSRQTRSLLKKQIKPSKSSKLHKTMRRIMKPAIRSIMKPAIRNRGVQDALISGSFADYNRVSKFTTPLWIDNEYMKICQFIKAYL
jgi:hypothetical protein